MKVLAVDYGKVRTGLALSDPSGFLASGLETVEERNSDQLVAHIAQCVAKHQVEKIVLGLPKNMDGSIGESAQNVIKLAQQMKDATGLEVVLWDERRTTVSAQVYLNTTNTRGKKRKAVIDTVAATIILQEYLDSQISQRKESL